MMRSKKNIIHGKFNVINILLIIFLFQFNLGFASKLELEGKFLEIKILDKVNTKNTTSFVKSIPNEKNILAIKTLDEFLSRKIKTDINVIESGLISLVKDIPNRLKNIIYILFLYYHP